MSLGRVAILEGGRPRVTCELPHPRRHLSRGGNHKLKAGAACGTQVRRASFKASQVELPSAGPGHCKVPTEPPETRSGPPGTARE